MTESRFVGVWKLISCVAIRKNGDGVPLYGDNPIGRLYYDEAGNMSVHFMRADRPHFHADSKFRAAPAEMSEAFEGYEAYCSRYSVDAENGMIHHTVIASLFPNWTGTVQSRYYAFEGKDRLIFSTERIGTHPSGKTILRLVWERIS
jgi:lipocalin-like protein